jgi:glycosyltransferase involved in cell wall biosynthesis
MPDSPTKFAEAFTCGVPIISTNVSDIKYFADGDVILIDDTSEEAILSAMKQAIDNGSKERSVKNSFDYSNYLNETKQWLLKIYD